MVQDNRYFRVRSFARIVLALGSLVLPAAGQAPTPNPLVEQGPRVNLAPSQAPLTLTFQDALARAQRYETTFLSAVNAADLAREDTVQARAALFPSSGLRSEYLNTQGNGVFPSGRYVTNDGVHVYREWAVFHQDLSPGTLTRSGYRRSGAAEVVARAKAEVARRGLTVTVTKAYYALVAAQRKYASAQLALDQAQSYLTISQELERGGEAPHSDVVKAQIQYNSQDQAVREAKLAIGASRLDLAVLMFPDFNQNFQVVDDLHLTSALPPIQDVEVMAKRENPDLRAATEALRGANLDITVARQAYLPTLTLDVDYGLEANQLGWKTIVAADPAKGPVASPGYFLTAALTFPVWDWGARKSKLKQAQLRRQQANVELSATQRTVLRELNGFYEEAQTARDELDLLRQSADLATENLRLNTLRYQGGEATILELVDAQNTLTQARNAYDDGLVRYRVAVANLQTVTGPF
jgi:outer membrane protein TolC